QDGVAQAGFKRDLVPSNVNAGPDSMSVHESSAIRHCVFRPLAEARAGSGAEINSDASSTAWPTGVGLGARYGTRTRMPAIGASQTSISRCLERYLIAVRDGTKPARGEK